MDNRVNQRKIEHIEHIANDPEIDRCGDFFDQIRLTHRGLPEIDFNEVDPSCDFLGKKLSFPFLISSMTGGNHDLINRVNRHLAEAAEATGVALATGSMRVLFTDPESADSFELRKYAPNTVLLGNVGAVQLNYGYTLEHCEKAVKTLGADGLYFHLNPLQEAVQPEGDLNFKDLLPKIAEIAANLSVPVLLKEVGAGLSPQDIEKAYKLGLRHFDIAGTGGTSWSRIEYHRQNNPAKRTRLGLTFQDWGIPTPLALKLAQPWAEKSTIIASGGLRSGIDMVKSVVLGARLGGFAKPLLEPAKVSTAAVIEVIEELKQEFVTAMFLLGCKTFDDLWLNTDLILPTEL